MTTDSSGGIVGEQWYYAFGQTRFTINTMPTDKLFTGQREMTGLGIYYYNARFYSPYINCFLSADTIVPSYANPQSLNRYSYVVNNPLRYTDPSGHRCDPDDDCGGPHYSSSGQIYNWKWRIKHKYGVTMSDDGGKDWGATNLSIIYSGLQSIDKALNGTLNSLIAGTTFWLKKQTGTGQYHGVTHLDGSGINFFTLGNDAIRQMNILHEVGHLLDNVPGLKDVFTNAVKSEKNPSWVSNGFVSEIALVSGRVPDIYYGDTDAIQAFNSGESEEWADAFANYVAGNIDLSKPTGPGVEMQNFVTNILFEPPNNHIYR